MTTIKNKIKKESLSSFEKKTLGFCTPFEPPKVYSPSQKNNKFLRATEIHERCHGILIYSTIYGIAEQILAHLLSTNCPHIENDILIRSFQNYVKNSFFVHEGCATLCGIGHVEATQPENIDEYKATIKEDYLEAASCLSTVVDLFELDGYLKDWIAIQIASLCLSPPLFGPLSKYENYNDGKILSIIEDKNYSPDKRLKKIIDDSKRENFSILVNNVKNTIEKNVETTFPSKNKPNFNDDFLRHKFIRICEPQIEKCFSEYYSNFYINYHSFTENWKNIWAEIISDFQNSGCNCLSHLSFNHESLIENQKLITPVIIPDRRSPGAVELDELSNLPIKNNEQYYIELYFGDKTEHICNNPERLLNKNHLYVRFQKIFKTESSLNFTDFYWFKFFTPSEITDTLNYIARIPGIVVCGMSGDFNQRIIRLNECNECSIFDIYLLINGMTKKGFLNLIDLLPSPRYDMFVMQEKDFHDLILYLKDPEHNFHICLPVTYEVLISISNEVENIDKIKIEGAKPTLSDMICSNHYCISGW